MLFCSQAFLLFFIVVFSAYWALPWQRARVYLLLVASFSFYASWNKWLAILICISTTLDYVLARGIERTISDSGRKALLVVSLAANLSLLCYFKYANFFLDSLDQALLAVGVAASLPALKVILPIGISFYTFEAISYIVDVYKRRIAAEQNLAHFMLFILFFPHLVAGPIVRARDFLPQVARIKRWDWARLHLGAQYFLMGLFKKLAIADHMALFADPVFADPGQYRTWALWKGVFAYAVQIYCDFSGYSDMAIGAAHMLGYKLPLNFNMPYLSRNMSEFWQRWHISLSSWLRDYVFTPLGSFRRGTWQSYRNLFVTMTVGGLWHGANWTFVVFGMLHGLILVAHRVFQHFCRKRRWPNLLLANPSGAAFCVVVTFLTFSISLVVFRASTLATAATMLRGLLGSSGMMSSPMREFSLWWIAAVVALCHGLAASGTWRRMAGVLPAPVLGCGYAMVLTLTLVLAPQANQAFIYFQF